MTGNSTTGFDVGYRAVEAALAATHRIPPQALGALRGRFTAVQKLGLFGAKNMPGRGRALRYTPDLLHRAVFACELFELGITPAVVISIVEARWERQLRKIFRDAEDAAEADAGAADVILHMGGVHLMADAFAGRVPAVDASRLCELPDKMAGWITPRDPIGEPPRVVIVNLSARLRSFHAALADSYMDELSDEVKKAAPKRGAKAKA